jgi:Tfp pilus assembly protein PilV
MSARAGFTLIDTLIAIVLLEAGLLGLAATLASGERLVAQGRTATRAALDARALLARYAQSDTVCAASNGDRVLAGARINWAPDGVASLRRVTVVLARPSGPVADSVATLVRCA